MREQFDEAGTAGLELPFAGKRFRVTVKNPDRLECGDYRIESASVDGREIPLAEGEAYAAILQADIAQLSDEVHEIEILLGKGEDGQQ